jgi:hypothetical protein
MEDLRELVLLVAVGAAIGLMAIIDAVHDKLRNKEQ